MGGKGKDHGQERPPSYDARQIGRVFELLDNVRAVLSVIMCSMERIEARVEALQGGGHGQPQAVPPQQEGMWQPQVAYGAMHPQQALAHEAMQQQRLQEALHQQQALHQQAAMQQQAAQAAMQQQAAQAAMQQQAAQAAMQQQAAHEAMQQQAAQEAMQQQAAQEAMLHQQQQAQHQWQQHGLLQQDEQSQTMELNRRLLEQLGHHHAAAAWQQGANEAEYRDPMVVPPRPKKNRTWKTGGETCAITYIHCIHTYIPACKFTRTPQL